MANEFSGITITDSQARLPAPLISPADKLHVQRGVLERNPGYALFQSSYLLTDALRKQEEVAFGPKVWHKFIFHDIQTRASLFSAFTVGTKNNELGDLANRYNNEIHIDKQLELLEQMTRAPRIRNDVFPPALLDEYEEKLVRFARLFPAFKASAQFLVHPGDAEYMAMINMKVPLSTVLDYHFIPSDPRFSQYSLNGFEAIIAFNFLKNAVDHSPQVEKKGPTGTLDMVPDTTRIRVEVDNDTLSVSNNSNDAQPGEGVLFHLGGKGEHGNSGFGMFTAAKLYAPLIGKHVEPTWTAHNAVDHTKYSVRFSLKKSLQASNESPLPQPVR
jgi:hypothetical protein